LVYDSACWLVIEAHCLDFFNDSSKVI